MNYQWLKDNPGTGFVALLDGKPLQQGDTFIDVFNRCAGHDRMCDILFAGRTSNLPSVSVGDHVRYSTEYLKKRGDPPEAGIARGIVWKVMGDTITVQWSTGGREDVPLKDLWVSPG
jgi:hypothetical protein